MFSALEISIAQRFMRARKSERAVSLITGFSFIGVMLGVATLIVVMSVMNGFREEITKSVLGLNGHIIIKPGPDKGITDHREYVDKIAKLKEVTEATPLVEGQALVFQNRHATGVIAHGLAPEDLKKRAFVVKNMKLGSIDDFAKQSDNIIIGMDLAKRLGAFPGDMVTLVAPEANSTAFGLIPRMRAFKVAAVFKVGMTTFDKGLILMHLDAAQQFFRLSDQVNQIEVFTKNPHEVATIREQIKPLKLGVHVLDWQQLNKAFFTSIEIERNMMFVILSMIILVATFNIISSITMLIKDKHTSIGILRAMGLSRSSIQRIFFLCGASIGLMGTLLGLALGLLISFNITAVHKVVSFLAGTNVFDPQVYFLEKLPSSVDSTQVVVIILVALVLTAIATYLPAARAAALHPVEALRHE